MKGGRMGLLGPGYPVKREGIVNLKQNDRAFRGILWRVGRGVLELRQATMVEHGSKPVQVDGLVLIPLENIDFVQIVR